MKALLFGVALGLGCGSIAQAGERWIAVAGGEWQADARTLQFAQDGIEAFVQERAKAAHRPLREWSSYRFQYQGQVENGRKFLYLSAFCAADAGVDLRARFYLVTDGGSCYFTLRFDPSQGRFFDLIINGEA